MRVAEGEMLTLLASSLKDIIYGFEKEQYMSIQEFALRLKAELKSSGKGGIVDFNITNKIAKEINDARHSDGSPLTDEEKETIINYLRFDDYDPKTGRCSIKESDNSELLKLVDMVSQKVNKKS